MSYLGGGGGVCASSSRFRKGRAGGVVNCAIVGGTVGCRRLEYLNCEGCHKITNEGVKSLVRGCGRLKVLNLYQCVKVGDGGIVRVAERCRGKLQSLNVGYCRRVSDASLLSLAEYCGNLQALNLEGCCCSSSVDNVGSSVSEAGLCALVRGCAGLSTLNVTGCQNVTRNGLLALIEGLRYVREAERFFGFVPRDDAMEQKMRDQFRMIEDSAAGKIQCQARNNSLRRESIAIREEKRWNRAALRVQISYSCYQKRRRRWERNMKRKKNTFSILIQSVARMFLSKRKAKLVLQERDAMRQNDASAIYIQAIFRGYTIRRNDNLVTPALIAHRVKRQQQRENRAALLIQSVIIQFSQRCKEEALQRLWIRKNKIATRVQSLARRYLAIQKRNRLRYERNLQFAIHSRAAMRIQTSFHNRQRIHEARLFLTNLKRTLRRRHHLALKIQSLVRGYLGRTVARSLLEAFRERVAKAVLLQRVFRGSRVLHWKDIKLNKVAAYVYRRQYREFDTSALSATHRVANYDEGLNTEEYPASDCDEDENDVNTLTATSSSSEEPRRNTQADKSIVGLPCKIYWPANDKYFTGTVTKFNVSKTKWRVDYDDGDHEWINLEKHSDRVLLLSNGSWKDFRMYQPPVLTDRWVRDERRKQREADKTAAWDVAHSWVKLDPGRYYSALLDEIRICDNDANNGNERQHGDNVMPVASFDEWNIIESNNEDDDDNNDWYYVHRDGKRVHWTEPDPRFPPPEDTPEMKQLKNDLVSELRFGAYVCRGLLEEYYCYNDSSRNGNDATAASEKSYNGNNNIIGRRFKDNLRRHEAVKKMASALSRARQVWDKVFF